jgi:alpha-beta hydrolase superfamily lysophospholipase
MRPLRAGLGLVTVGLVITFASAASGYRNPTPGRVLVVQVPGMHRAKVKRNLVYRTVDGVRLHMDVYRPRRARGALPAVVLGGSPAIRAGRRSGQKIGWSQLIAAYGMAAVDVDLRSDNSLRTPAAPASDAEAAVAYVRDHARSLGVDPSRLCTLGISNDSGPWLIWAGVHEHAPWIRCSIDYYGRLDFSDPALAEYSALRYLQRDGGTITPMLIAEAGRDEPAVNESMGRFASKAHAVHADVRVLTNRTGRHGFDVRAPTARSRAIVRETIRYLRSRLARPLRLEEDCVTPSERAGIVELYAADDTRLVGLNLGSGRAGVVVSHEGNGDICSWLTYARELAASGLRVLDIDLRGHGSSETVYGARYDRVDLDVTAAAEFLRRTGTPRVALAGGSLGAIASVVSAAALDPAPAAVVSVSGPETDGPLRAMRAVQRLRAPVLFAASEDDVPYVDAARRLYALAASPDKHLLVRPGVAHGIALLTEDAAARSAVTAFLRGRLGS